MGCRRKKESLVEALMFLPWWFGVGLGISAFIGLRWMLPSILPPILKGLVPVMQMFSWVVLALFGVPGLISLVRAKIKSASDASSPLSIPTSRSPAQKQTRLPATEQQAKVMENWTVEALREIEWKRFELLCAKYYETVGFKSKTLRCGADGGIDVKLYRVDPTKPFAIVQCKAWNSAVGVKEVRELLGVMTHEKVTHGVFITTSSYTKDALSFGETNPIQLLDGPAVIRKIQELPVERQDELFKFAFAGDYSTPTCASCGTKMVKRESKRGVFWGCVRYPKCRSKFHIKGSELLESA